MRVARGRVPMDIVPPAEDPMLDDIYNRRILELAADIPRLGRLENPDATATAHSRLCGSTVTVDLVLGEDGRYAHADAHLAATAAVSGLERLAARPAEVRREGGRPVPGRVVVLRRTSA